MSKKDTIAAIATGSANAGISVIRISGEDAFLIGNKIFSPVSGINLREASGYSAHYGKIIFNGEVLDEAVVLIMRAPHSYTGEDTVEISCHGGILITRTILSAILEAGARAAEPGEFTKRAFLNGRMDLAEAEAVIDVIEAKNDFARKAFLGQLEGRVSDKIIGIREEILDSISYIEAALDDPEHISLEGYGDELKEKLNEILGEINKLIKSFQDGKVLVEGIKTVILGKPNAGKSSLMNLFAGEEKAIVTEIAGTTRDVLSEQINIAGTSFMIVDTAGIRDTSDIVEKIGVRRSMRQAEDADLILYVVDSSTPLDENDKKIISFISDKKSIIIYNKTDLSPIIEKDELLKLSPGSKVIGISAKNATDFDELKKCMVDLFETGEIDFNDQVVITNLRHKQALLDAKESIGAVLESMKNGFGEDLWTIDLTDAYAALGLIIGEAVDEDVVNRIFEKFCMGK